jgi:hypothetical protein
MRNVHIRSRHTARRKYHRALATMENLEPRVLLSGIVTSYASIATTPHPTLPAKYASYTDPDFGTKVIRLTDATDGNDNHNAYSYWPSFNKDNTRIMIWKSTRAELYSFNPTTMAISDLGALFATNAPDGSILDWQDAIWSANDPNTIYAHANTGAKLWAYNTSTHVYTLVHDFSGDSGWAAGDYINQVSKSMDDNVFAFARKNASYATIGWEVYKVSTNSAVKFVNNSNLDEVQLDKSGNWLVEKYGDSSGDNVWNLSTGTATWLVDGSPDYSPDHSDMGNGIIVAAENWQNNTTERSLSSPHSFTNIFVPPPANEGGALWQDGHISMLMDGDQWAFKSLEYTGTKTGPFLREFFLVATDGSGRVIRFGHNYTVNVANYWHNSFGNISRDGRFAIVTSDMGDPNRTDVYIIRVPIPGDANLDYLVDGTDLAIYNANAGGSGKTWAQGDWNADGLVNSADLALWTANQTNPGSPTVTISANDPTATEAAGDGGQWTVTRTGSTSAALTVNISKSGTATNGTDYNSIGSTVTIPVGASSATINLTPIQDSLVEGTETAIITLASGTGYTVGSPSSATVNINDDDVPTVTIAATDATASETLPNNGVWTVTRTGPTTAALTVNFSKSGSATDGTDYNSIGTSVTIPVGAASATITLTPIDDALVEGSETAIITLASGTGYAVGSPSSDTVTITDNDSGGGSTPSYDGFGYTPGGGANWNGGAGGSGWGGNWSIPTPADAGVVSGSLAYSGLSTSGNKVTLWHQDTASRNTSMSYGTDGTSRWVGVLMNAAFSGGTNPYLGGEIDLGTQLKIGTVWAAPLALRSNIGGSETFAGSTFTPTANSTYFLVARIDYGATDVVRLWVNPTPGTQPSDASASATLTLPAGQSFSVGNNITLNGGGYYDLANFDELRYGSTYADVAPSSASPPAAPTNLVATPGTSTIGLTWTDNASTESGFHIWRSTDNVNWGSVYATVGANVASYTDPAPTQGTGYFYKVTAYNGAGDSAAATMTSARATVLGSDDFNYSTFNGGSGGLGFSGNWSVSAPADSGTTAGSLTYSSGGHALVTSGNHVWLWHQATASRNVSTSFGTDGTSRWFSFLHNASFNGGTNPNIGGELDIGPSGGPQLKVGAAWGSDWSMRAPIGANEYFATSSTPVPTGTTTFIVVRVDYGSTDTVRMWVNPTPGVQPSDASAAATLTLPAGVTFSVGNTLTLNGGTYYTQAQFDELRYGLSYAAVAPDPLTESTTRPRSTAATPILKSWSLPVSARVAPVGVTATLSTPDSLQLRTDHLDWSAAGDATTYHTYRTDAAMDDQNADENANNDSNDSWFAD